MMDSGNLLEAALQYASRGWRVLPLHTPVGDGCSCGKPECSSAGKHPRNKRGLNEATTNEGQIRYWWRRWPSANVGIATGSESGLLVLDVDDKNGKAGSVTLDGLQADNGSAIETLTVQTGNGKHLYFRHPGVVIGNSVQKLGAGIDVRAERGYVVAPPSVHSNGVCYLIQHECTPCDVPEWLLSILKGEEPVAVEGMESAEVKCNPFTAAPSVQEGERNETLFKLGSALRGQYAKELDEITAILLEFNGTKCKPPLSETEVLRIAESICKQFPAEASSKKSAKRQDENPLYWFKFNLRNWFSDQNIALMTDRQTGWYIRLLAYAWQDGGFLTADVDKLYRLAKASSRKNFMKDCGIVLSDFVEVEINGQRMLKNTKMAAQYASTLEDWMKKKAAGEASKERRMSLAQKNNAT